MTIPENVSAGQAMWVQVSRGLGWEVGWWVVGGSSHDGSTDTWLITVVIVSRPQDHGVVGPTFQNGRFMADINGGGDPNYLQVLG